MRSSIGWSCRRDVSSDVSLCRLDDTVPSPAPRSRVASLCASEKPPPEARTRMNFSPDLFCAPDDSQGSAPELPANALVIVPVRGFVLFPRTVFPIAIGRKQSIAAAQEAVRTQRQVGILMQREAQVADPSPIDLHRVGTVANIVRYITAHDGTQHLV